MTKVAIVILNWNGCKLLQEFLPSVVKFSTYPDVEIVVVDNASTDGSISFLETNYPSLTSIHLPQNYGYAEGYNQALKQIEAEYYVLLNSDVEVSEGWLMPVIDYMDNHVNVAAAQPKILAHRNKKLFEYAGAAGGFIDKYGYPFCRGRIFDEVEVDRGQYDDIVDVFWASGACLFIRSSDFFDAGGLDASFFAHMEEIDLCWRLNARGKKIVCIPKSVVYHVGGATLSEESPRKTFLNFRNNLLMIYKNMPEQSLRKVMNIRLFLDYLAAFQLMLKGKTANAKAVLSACKEFRKIKVDYDAIRQENITKTTNYSIPTIYPESILWDFFIKGNRLFYKLHKFRRLSKI